MIFSIKSAVNNKVHCNVNCTDLEEATRFAIDNGYPQSIFYVTYATGDNAVAIGDPIHKEPDLLVDSIVKEQQESAQRASKMRVNFYREDGRHIYTAIGDTYADCLSDATKCLLPEDQEGMTFRMVEDLVTPPFVTPTTPATPGPIINTLLLPYTLNTYDGSNGAIGGAINAPKHQLETVNARQTLTFHTNTLSETEVIKNLNDSLKTESTPAQPTEQPRSQNPEHGIRLDQGKPMMQLLSPIAMMGTANVLTWGCNKYGPGNWKKGMAWGKVIGSLLRHTFKFMAGEDFDEETGLPHVDHIATNAMFLQEYFRKHKNLDDRMKTGLE